MTIALQISNPKIPKKDNFGTKFWHFHYFTLFCNQTNPRVLISNMTIDFQPKITQKQKTPKSPKVPKFRNFCFFTKILQFRKFEDASFTQDNSFFKFQSKNTQLKHFWWAFFLSNLGIFVFLEILQLHKFEGSDFKYVNIVFKFQPKNTQISYFCFGIQAFWLVHKILELH